MDFKDLVPGDSYVVLDEVSVCYYEGEDCLMPEGPNLPKGTILTYVGPDPDVDGGFIFTDEAGTKFCFHNHDILNNDLNFITFAK